MPSMTTRSSIVSRVVPSISLTIARSSPTKALSNVDLPAFVGPTIATAIPFLMAFPARKDLTNRSKCWESCTLSADNSERSANSNSSWSAKSSSNSTRLVKCSSCSLSASNSVVIPPLRWLSAKSFSAFVSDAIKSATASACVRSIFPLRKARCVNSPAFAKRHPSSVSQRSNSCWMKRLPWQAISTTSSPVNECGARKTDTNTSSKISSFCPARCSIAWWIV